MTGKRLRWMGTAMWMSTAVVSTALVPHGSYAAEPAGDRSTTRAPATKKPVTGTPAQGDADSETTTMAEQPKAEPPPADATTFEAMLRDATPTGDLGTLLALWVGKCDGEKRELDRVRCRSIRGYLRKVIPARSFSAIVEDPATIAVSEFDASIKGYHLSIAGCLACSQPVAVGPAKEKRLITMKAPAKEAESLRAGVELSRNSVGFDSLREAKFWLEQSRPDLRTQFVFKPAHSEWTFGGDHGYAMTMQGFRVFNRCTGEVLISRPPSTEIAAVQALDEGCRKRDVARDAGATSAAKSDLQPQLTKNEISQTMNTIRPQVFACFEKFHVPGLAQFDFVVAGNGTVNSVRLSGAFFGTPTGACLLDAAKDAHFPRFSKERQQFVYPFFLRQ